MLARASVHLLSPSHWSTRRVCPYIGKKVQRQGVSLPKTTSLSKLIRTLPFHIRLHELLRMIPIMALIRLLGRETSRSVSSTKAHSILLYAFSKSNFKIIPLLRCLCIYAGVDDLLMSHNIVYYLSPRRGMDWRDQILQQMLQPVNNNFGHYHYWEVAKTQRFESSNQSRLVFLWDDHQQSFRCL